MNNVITFKKSLHVPVPHYVEAKRFPVNVYHKANKKVMAFTTSAYGTDGLDALKRVQNTLSKEFVCYPGWKSEEALH